MTERIKNSQEWQNETIFDRQWQGAVQNYINAHTVEVNSRYAYAGDISQLKDFLSRNAADNWSRVTPQIMRDFFKDQKNIYSPATFNRRLTVINGFISYLRRRTDYPITEDVTQTLSSFRKDKANRPKRDFEYKPLSRDEFSKLLGAAENLRDKVILQLLRSDVSTTLIAACRIQHLRINWDGENDSISIYTGKKDKEGRPLRKKLDREASRVAREYLNRDRKADIKKPHASFLLRHNCLGEPIKDSFLTRGGIYSIFYKLADKAQIDCTPHRLNKSEKALHESSN